jgi:hypothetical protein
MQLVWDDFIRAQGRLLNASATTPALLFTTESTDMVQEQINFSSSHPDFPFRVASNVHDVLPGTGFMPDAAASVSRDASLLSSMTSLQFQMLARVTLGNCCSNHHNLLADFLAVGCGAASANEFHCSLDLNDPNLWMCCGWLKKCAQIKRNAIREWKLNSSVSVAVSWG